MCKQTHSYVIYKNNITKKKKYFANLANMLPKVKTLIFSNNPLRKATFGFINYI